MGVFLGAMSDTTPPILAIGGKEVPQAPLREQVKVAFRATGTSINFRSFLFFFVEARGNAYNSFLLVQTSIRVLTPWTHFYPFTVILFREHAFMFIRLVVILQFIYM